MAMKISTEIASAAKQIGEVKTLEYVGKAGFDAWDFSMFAMFGYDWNVRKRLPTDHPLAGPDYLTFARELKQVGLDYGMVCNQSHAPFPTDGPGAISYLKRAIECTAEAGGELCVIHPVNTATVEENTEMYQKLLPFAKECGVKIATENMWNWDPQTDCSLVAPCSTSESFLAQLNAVRDSSFVACLDIGHAEMQGSGSGAANMIRALGSHLQALHLHDNDRRHDSHQLPFTMDIDFSAVVEALKDIGYQGYLTLEADQYLNAYDATNIFEGIRNMSVCARKLADMYTAGGENL